MTHRVFIGPFSALEPRWMQEVGRLQANDPLAAVCVLVGSNILASHLKTRITDAGQAVANLRLYTFLDLATRLAYPMGIASDIPRLPHLGASWILEKLLEAGTPEVFREVARFPGFRAAVLDTFRDLRDAGITPNQLESDLRRLIGDYGHQDEALDRERTLLATAALYRRFRAQLSFFRDVDDDFRQALGNAPQAADILQTDNLTVYGIYDVTGQQADLLRALKDSLEVTYFVPSTGDASSGFASPFIEARSSELGVNPERLQAGYRETGLDRFASRIFSGWHDAGQGGEARNPERAEERSAPLAADGTVALLSVPGESRSAVEIVREILRAVRDGVISGFYQAAVFLRRPEDEAAILAEAFRLRGIPYFLQGGSSLLERPLGQAMLAIAALKTESFSRQAILRAAELIAAALPAELAGLWPVSRWRALTNHPRFLAGIESWDLGTEALIQEAGRRLRRAEARADRPDERFDEDGEAESISQARQRMEAASTLRTGWLALKKAAAGWPEMLSWRNWIDFLEQRLAPLLSGSLDWPSFSAVLDGLGSLDHVAQTARFDREVCRSRVIEALRESLQSLSCPRGRFQKDGVNILSLTAARGLRFPLVVVPGLDEGRFPASLREDPLLLDSERLSIGRPPRLALKLRRREEEKLLFDMAVRAAEKRLVLVTSRLDESTDRETIPSDFFLRAVSAALGRTAGYRDLNDQVPGFRSVPLDQVAPSDGEIATNRTEIRLRLISRGAKEALMQGEEPLLKRPLAFNEARWQKRLTPYDGQLRDPELVRWVSRGFGPDAGPVSATWVEEYAKCPYFFFLKRVMGLESWEEQESALGMDPLERGEVIHRVLEAFMRERGSRLLHSPAELLQKSLRDLAQRNLEAARPAGIHDLLWEIERDALLGMLERWLAMEIERAEEGLLPARFEHVFGELPGRESAASYRVLAGKYQFDFRGRIDRVDLSSDGTRARVLDYKVGTLPRSMSARKATVLMGGEKMQVAVYRGAVSALPEFAAVRDIRGEYLHLQPKDGQVVGCAYAADRLNDAVGRLPKILELVGEGIESGAFFARTEGNVRGAANCNFCPYESVCGKDRYQHAERKAADPASLRFQQMAAIDGIVEEEE